MTKKKNITPVDFNKAKILGADAAVHPMQALGELRSYRASLSTIIEEIERSLAAPLLSDHERDTLDAFHNRLITVRQNVDTLIAKLSAKWTVRAKTDAEFDRLSEITKMAIEFVDKAQAEELAKKVDKLESKVDAALESCSQS